MGQVSGYQPQDVVLCSYQKDKPKIEDRTQNILLKCCTNENGKYEKATPEKLLKALGEEIGEMQKQPDNDCFLGNSYGTPMMKACINPNDAKNALKTTLEILALLKSVDVAVSDLFGFSIKDAVDWVNNKFRAKEEQPQVVNNGLNEQEPNQEINIDA